MEVRCPAAVPRRCADRADPLAGPHRGARPEPFQRARREVAVQRVERHALAGAVFQHDRRAEVEAPGVVAQRVDGAVQRREDRRAGLDEQIHAQVDRAPLGPGVRLHAERVLRRPAARLIVAADPDFGALRAQPAEEEVRPCLRVVPAVQPLEIEAADAQVEGDAPGLREPDAEHRCHPAGMGTQPPDHRGRPGTRLEPAGMPHHVMREVRTHRREPVEQRPDACLADGEVRVVRIPLPLACRVDRAHAEPQADQRVESLDLRFRERIRLVVAAHHVRRRRERVALPQHRVRRADRRLADHPRADQVAEVDQAGHPRRGERVAAVLAHQHVVVVAVAVDDGRTQLRQQRDGPRVEERGEPLDPGSSVRLGHVAEPPVHDATAVAKVPLQLAARRGVHEVVEDPVDRAEQPAHVLEERRGVRPEPRERDAGDVFEQANEVRRVVARRDLRHRLARARRDDPGEPVRRLDPREPLDHSPLAVQQRRVLARLRQLQHVRHARRHREVEVLVALARKRTRGGAEAVQLERHALGLIDREPGRPVTTRRGVRGVRHDRGWRLRVTPSWAPQDTARHPPPETRRHAWPTGPAAASLYARPAPCNVHPVSCISVIRNTILAKRGDHDPCGVPWREC